MCLSTFDETGYTGTQLRTLLQELLGCKSHFLTRRLLHIVADPILGTRGMMTVWVPRPDFDERVKRIKEGEIIPV